MARTGAAIALAGAAAYVRSVGSQPRLARMRRPGGGTMHKIIFSGELVAGFDTEEVKANLGKLFKIEDSAKLDALFSGKDITLKKNLEAEQARRYEATLSNAGAMVRIDPPLTQFDDEEEDLPPPTTSGNALNFNTIAMATPEALAAGEMPAAGEPATTDEPPRSKAKLLLMLLAVVVILLVGIFISVQFQEANKADVLNAAGDEEAEFEQELEQVDDPELRETLRNLRALMQEAEAEAKMYEERDAQMQQDLDAAAAAAEPDSAADAPATPEE